MPQIGGSWRQTLSHFSDAAIFQHNGERRVIYRYFSQGNYPMLNSEVFPVE